MWTKICCIRSIEEARFALEAGANAIGLVAAMPSGPGPIEDDCIRGVARWVRDESGFGLERETTLLTSRTEPSAVVEHALYCETTTVQLVDAVPLETYALLRARIPHLRIMQVIHVEDEEALVEAMRVWPYVDRILLDSGRPRAPIKLLGGTGQVHDWGLSRRLVEASAVPVVLAGGLKPENVREAIEVVKPFGLDVCSGLRSDGALRPEKLRAFLREISAWESRGEPHSE